MCIICTREYDINISILDLKQCQNIVEIPKSDE
jgi:hypothetical protein